MTIYNYEITYVDGHSDKMTEFLEPIDLEELTKKEWTLIHCDSYNLLIRMEQVATIREDIEELSDSDSLEFALKRTNWSESKTMEMLDISSRTLYRLMKLHHLNTGALKP